jgi:hypothetical protein
MAVVYGNNEGEEQVVMEVWICRRIFLFVFLYFMFPSEDFFFYFGGDPK